MVTPSRPDELILSAISTCQRENLSMLLDMTEWLYNIEAPLDERPTRKWHRFQRYVHPLPIDVLSLPCLLEEVRHETKRRSRNKPEWLLSLARRARLLDFSVKTHWTTEFNLLITYLSSWTRSSRRSATELCAWIENSEHWSEYRRLIAGDLASRIGEEKPLDWDMSSYSLGALLVEGLRRGEDIGFLAAFLATCFIPPQDNQFSYEHPATIMRIEREAARAFELPRQLIHEGKGRFSLQKVVMDLCSDPKPRTYGWTIDGLTASGGSITLDNIQLVVPDGWKHMKNEESRTSLDMARQSQKSLLWISDWAEEPFVQAFVSSVHGREGAKATIRTLLDGLVFAAFPERPFALSQFSVDHDEHSISMHGGYKEYHELSQKGLPLGWDRLDDPSLSDSLRRVAKEVRSSNPLGTTSSWVRAITWFRKAHFATDSSDSLLFSWVALESIFGDSPKSMSFAIDVVSKAWATGFAYRRLAAIVELLELSSRGGVKSLRLDPSVKDQWLKKRLELKSPNDVACLVDNWHSTCRHRALSKMIKMLSAARTDSREHLEQLRNEYSYARAQLGRIATYRNRVVHAGFSELSVIPLLSVQLRAYLHRWMLAWFAYEDEESDPMAAADWVSIEFEVRKGKLEKGIPVDPLE